MGTLSCKMRVLEKLRDGQILEISFRGTHEWTHGQEMEGLSTVKPMHAVEVCASFEITKERHFLGHSPFRS